MRKGGNEKMKNKFVLIRYVLMLWMLCGVCHTQSVASAVTYTPQAASSWGYKPLHSVSASQVHVVGRRICIQILVFSRISLGGYAINAVL